MNKGRVWSADKGRGEKKSAGERRFVVTPQLFHPAKSGGDGQFVFSIAGMLQLLRIVEYFCATCHRCTPQVPSVSPFSHFYTMSIYGESVWVERPTFNMMMSKTPISAAISRSAAELLGFPMRLV